MSEIDIEAVAPRKEKYTPGSRKPEVSGGELEDDVKRRDFTANSLLHDLTTGETLDLTGMGKEDIKAGIIRTPLDPDVIFGEDPLRILRAVRFTAKYNWKISLANTGRKFSEQTKKRMSIAQTGKSLTEECRRKIGNSLRGKKMSKETRTKMSIAKKNITEETRCKMSSWQIGRKRDPITHKYI